MIEVPPFIIVERKTKSEIRIGCWVRCIARCVKTGRILAYGEGQNKLVDVGRQVVRDHLGGIGMRPSHMGVGQGQNPTTDGMDALESEVLRKTIDRRIQKTYGVDLQVVITTAEGNDTTFREIATFEDERMIARGVFSPLIPKTELAEVTLSHVMTVYSS